VPSPPGVAAGPDEPPGAQPTRPSTAAPPSPNTEYRSSERREISVAMSSPSNRMGGVAGRVFSPSPRRR
jgi:hypothetical protein